MIAGSRRPSRSAVVTFAALGLAGCIAHTRPENAAMVMPHPSGPDLAASQAPRADYPSIGGDILAGYTPADLAAARAAATRPIAKPKPAAPPGGN